MTRHTTKGLLLVGCFTAGLIVVGSDAHAQRGGRGGSFGGARPANFGGYGGAGAGSRTTTPIVGPAGGSGAIQTGGGSYTTQRGGTINYGGAAVGGTTAGGVTAGRGVGAVQVTTAGGKTATSVGRAAGAVGPGGNAVGVRSGATVGSGPNGSFSTAYRGGVAIGPQGAVAGGARVGTATGPGGTVTGAARGAAAVGPYGAVAGGSRAVVGAGGTYYRSAAVVGGQAVAVRANFRNFAQDYPVLTARWVGPTWRPVAWATLAATAGYPAEAAYYDYGSNVVIQDAAVYIDGQPAGTEEQYSQKATDIAAAGAAAKADPAADDWQPLGVFAMVKGEETTSSNIFQLAVNKAGVIRGEYYNALTDTTEPVAGSVDAATRRAAWTVADRKTPVYEAGVANLTRDDAAMLVHFGKSNTQQFSLVRIPQPDPAAPPVPK